MPQLYGDSSDEPGVVGTSDASDGVRAIGKDGNALSAHGTNNVAIYAKTVSKKQPAVYAESPDTPALVGTSDTSDGVRALGKDGNALSAHGTNNVAIYAKTVSKNQPAVYAESPDTPALVGTSDTSDGVRALGKDGNALSAHGTNNVAIYAKTVSKEQPAIYAESPDTPALVGISERSEGLRAVSNSNDKAAIAAFGNVAGYFKGHVNIDGRLKVGSIDDLHANLDRLWRKVEALEAKVAQLQNSPPSPSGGSISPTFSASVNGGKIYGSGSGHRPNSDMWIIVNNDNLQTEVSQTQFTTDGSGGFSNIIVAFLARPATGSQLTLFARSSVTGVPDSAQIKVTMP